MAPYFAQLKNTALVLTALLALGFRAPRLGGSLFRAVEAALARLARRRVLAILLTGGLALLLSLIATWLVGVPVPAVHDEFSYLLAADTFVQGHLANPPHPMWPHFESFHILQQPTYASKYPPGQGLALAVGIRLFGHPICGVWLSTALAAAALCWMLYAWLPPRWALLGGLLAAGNMTLLEWSLRYWGGAVAVLGGALLFGGFRRLLPIREPLPHSLPCSALGMSVGVGLLAISRPYEGAVLTLIVLGSLPYAWFQAARIVRRRWLAAIAPACLFVLSLTAGGTVLYNRAVTGSPFQMPYVVHERAYDAAPLFLFQQPRPIPIYRHRVMEAFWRGPAYKPYALQSTPAGFLRESWKKLAILTVFLRPLLLGSPLLLLPWPVLRNSRPESSGVPGGAWAAFVCLAFSAALLPETFLYNHYAAPAFGPALLLIVLGLRRARAWRPRGRPAGLLFMRGLLLFCIVSLLHWMMQIQHLPHSTWPRTRQRMLNTLRRAPEKSLVIVRYGPHHDLHSEWVYNEANIPAAHVVWAREMDPDSNRALIRYFRDRKIWLLAADAPEPELKPYPVKGNR